MEEYIHICSFRKPIDGYIILQIIFIFRRINFQHIKIFNGAILAKKAKSGPFFLYVSLLHHIDKFYDVVAAF